MTMTDVILIFLALVLGGGLYSIAGQVQRIAKALEAKNRSQSQQGMPNSGCHGWDADRNLQGPQTILSASVAAERRYCISLGRKPSLLHTSFDCYWWIGGIGALWQAGEWTQGGEASQGEPNMLAPWVEDEVKTAKLNDKRLNERLAEVLSQLALYIIVAWRTLYVRRLGRSCPETSCEAVFDPAEWKSVWKVIRREDPPAEPPPLGVFVRMVAQLGGYVNRKRGDPPGPQTVWIGLQRMHDFATCWQMFGPGAQATP